MAQTILELPYVSCPISILDPARTVINIFFKEAIVSLISTLRVKNSHPRFKLVFKQTNVNHIFSVVLIKPSDHSGAAEFLLVVHITPVTKCPVELVPGYFAFFDGYQAEVILIIGLFCEHSEHFFVSLQSKQLALIELIQVRDSWVHQLVQLHWSMDFRINLFSTTTSWF